MLSWFDLGFIVTDRNTPLPGNYLSPQHLATLKERMENVSYSDLKNQSYFYNATILFCLIPTEMCIYPFHVGYGGKEYLFAVIPRSHDLHCI